MLRFLFVFAFFAFSFSVFSQNNDEAVKEKLRQETALLEQILTDAKNLRLAENRAFIYAKVGNALWQTDEKRARALFQSSIADLIAAQTEAEAEKGKKEYLNNLIYGQSPRWDILHIIAARDAEFALDALIKTRPGKIAQAISNLTGDNQSPSRQYARNEIQGEQRIIAMAVEQSPQRAVKLLRESLKKEVSYDTVNLLRKIHRKDPETANELTEAVGQKLLDTKLNEDNQDTNFIQNFLGELGQEKTEETATLKVSDRLLRDLAEKLVKFVLRPNATSFYMNPSALKVVERFFPASVAQIKQKQAKYENQNGQYQGYNKLMQGEASSEELISQADKYPRSYRNEIYRRAAEKTAQSGNIAEAQKIITTNLSEEESESYLSQLNYNLATQAISQGKFNEANQFINQMPEESIRLNALIYLATSIYQKAPQENQKWAATVLDEARSHVSDAPEKTSEINSLINVAAAYALIEPAQAFRLIESLTAPLNEFSEASAVVAKFSDYGNFRQGEYQITTGNNSLGVYNLTNVLQTLKNKDFDRVIRFTSGFSRLDVRVSLTIQLIDPNFSNSSFQNLPVQGRRIIYSH
ncbi:MAG TPA: hypothetical protein VNI60_00555 [Pyrinomonadaceae bacterium]|nr:hypothetical protein [Pyrinomonadaceae bacterium]